jgi:stalled ribosome alternative rescue factor ArfA
VAKKKKTRNPMAGVLAQPCFQKRVVKNKKAYTRKGTRAVAETFRDGSYFL